MRKSLFGRHDYILIIGTFLLEASVFGFGDAYADESAADQLQEVVVTARRQAESALKVPQSITVFGSSALENLNVQRFDEIATKVPNLSFQFGGSGGGNGAALGYGGGRAIAIRGVSGAGTTSFYIDDTPVPATIEPQLLDLDHMEVLKGPQGTLYGEGSMGGNVRLVTKAPDFSEELKFLVGAGYTDHAATPDGRTEVVGNFPVVAGVAAVRAAGFFNHSGGFITREFPVGSSGQLTSENNQGAVTDYGGSVSMLIKATESFAILPRIMVQTTDGHGLPTAYAPLPAFAVDSLTLVRQANVQEGYTDKWYLPSLELKYSGETWDLVSSTSYFHRYLSNTEDGTEGTTQILEAPPYSTDPSVWAGGVAWPQVQNNSNVYEELRAAWRGNEHVHAIIGYFYSNESQHWTNGSSTFNFPGLVTTGAYSSPLLWEQKINSGVLDNSIYGEAYFKTSGFELTLGLRRFRLDERFWSSSNGFLEGGYVETPAEQTSESGTNPKASLSYTASNGTLFYATAAKGFRAGGPNPPIIPACLPGLQQLGISPSQVKEYHSDSLWNYEIGAKGHIDGIAITAAVFEMKWDQIQQNVAIPICFLPTTGNAGAARIRGAELEVVGRPVRDIDFQLGLGYQDPRITEQGLTPQPVGSRILQVPFFTGSFALTYTHPLTSSVEGFASADYSYTGDSVSGTTTSLFGEPPVVRAGYSLLNARIGAKWERKKLSLVFRNITNVMANLGDVNPLAYPQTDPVTGLLEPRVAVQRPFQVALEFSYGM